MVNLCVDMLDKTIDMQGQPTSRSADEILLDKPGIARRLNKSVRTVDAWMKRGRLPYIKVGRSVLFRWGTVLEKLEAFRVN
jgi:excisionase family DNA binding protein